MVGLVHVYTGNGKGKTTSSLGLSLRAIGRGFQVHFIQFMKGNTEYGEVKAASMLPGFHLKQFGRPEFVDKKAPLLEDITMAREGLVYARKIMEGFALENVKDKESASSGGVEDDSTDPEGGLVLMVLDELNVALDFNLVGLQDVLDLIMKKPEEMELVITGRNAHPAVMEKADYVTEMKEIKHPYQQNIMARKGIEF